MQEILFLSLIKKIPHCTQKYRIKINQIKEKMRKTI